MPRIHSASWVFLAAVVSLTGAVFGDETQTPGKVLFVVAHKDFYYKEYADPRAALEEAGFDVVVAATRDTCIPHPGTGQTGDGVIRADVMIRDLSADDYAAVVFIGGWGASMYQPAFEGEYNNPEYRLKHSDLDHLNEVVAAMAKAGKPLTAICHGVSALAWCRVPESPVKGKNVVAYEGGGPGFKLDGKNVGNNQLPTRWHIEENGGKMAPANSIGDPATSADDVVIDGQIITAQNPASAPLFGQTLVKRLKQAE